MIEKGVRDNRQTVLIVDDTVLNIQVLNEILQADYRVLFATSGREALAVASESTPDIILLDIMMSEMDGYEVCRELKRMPSIKDIPIIFVTALGQVESETRGFELGAVDYITKPFNLNIVKLRLKNHLELKRQRDILARLSHTDGLTGIPNRREFDSYLQREWYRALRSRKYLSILMIDVDFFKRYNDRYGHTPGDDCLKKVAASIQASLLRPADLPARYGGEEFACILPDTDSGGALRLAQNILENVRHLNIRHEDSDASEFVTVSIGAASMIPDRGIEPVELTQQADNALYDAKANGRNRVAAFTVNRQ